MSRASWASFEDELRQLLKKRDVPKSTAKAIAYDIVSECGRYLNSVKFEYGNVDASTIAKFDDFHAFLRCVVPTAEKFRSLLNGYPTTIRWDWTPQNAGDLDVRLQKLIADAKRARDVWRRRRGAPPDRRRHHLEESVGDILERHGVETTTAPAGTFGLVIQQVHYAVGISERDVHKSVRRAHNALKKASKAS